MIYGQCNCGEIAFEISGTLTDIFICHCSICRKATGANGIAVVMTDSDSFRWTNGENLISTWQKPIGDWQTSFCKQCGSTLPGQNGPDSMYIPAGLLKDHSLELKVSHHIFTESKASWDIIGDRGKRHEGPFQGEI